MIKKVAKPILNFLEKNGVKHEILEHRLVFTAQDKAATLKIDEKQVVKSVVIKTDARNYGLVSIPSNKNLDLKKLKELINKKRKKSGEKAAGKIEFAKEAWFKKNLKNSEPGAVFPFGVFYKLLHFLDAALAKQKFLIINSGSNWQSVKITPAQLAKTEGVFLEKGSFSAAKPKKTKKKNSKSLKPKPKTQKSCQACRKK